MSTYNDCNNLLAAVMKQEKTPAKFLDEVFGYLKEHTSFFLEPSDKSNLGLPAGEAKKMVDESFTKHQSNKAESAAVLKENIKAEKEFFSPDSGKSQEDFQANPDSHNGAVREKYSWSQEESQVSVKFHLPAYIKKAKQLEVKYDAHHLHIKCQQENQYKPKITFLDGDFKYKVNTDDSATTWYMENGVLYVSYS